MPGFWQDVVYSLRLLRGKPGLTLVAVLSLALGIASNTVVFSIISATLLNPIPFENPHRLVTLLPFSVQNSDVRVNVSAGEYRAWEEQARSLINR